MTNETQEKLIAALLAPTIETMRLAGIQIMTIGGDHVVLQMNTGEVVTTTIKDPVRETVGTLIAWSSLQIGESGVDLLLKKLNG